MPFQTSSPVTLGDPAIECLVDRGLVRDAPMRGHRWTDRHNGRNAAHKQKKRGQVTLIDSSSRKSPEVLYKYFLIMATIAESHAWKLLSEPQLAAVMNAAFRAAAIQMSAYHSVLLPVWERASPFAHGR